MNQNGVLRPFERINCYVISGLQHQKGIVWWWSFQTYASGMRTSQWS